MLPDYEIVIGRGIGQILFGMTKAELAGLLGPPDETYEPDDLEKTGWETYGYDVIKCSFSFDPGYQDKLVEIAIENGYFHLFHQIRVGASKDDLLKRAAELNFEKPVFKDLDSDETPGRELILFSTAGLGFYLDDGVVTLIQISAILNPDHSITWPE